MPETQRTHDFGVAEGARKLVIDITLKTLIKHASVANPELGNQIIATVEAYLSTLPNSDLEAEFAAQVRRNLRFLVDGSS